MSCPLCSSREIRITGYRGLGILYKCQSCSTIFIENMPLEDYLIQSEVKKYE